MKWTLVVLFALLYPLASTAPRAPDPTQIWVATRLVQITVVADDKHGPVADLRKEEFELFDAGRPRDISVFSVQSEDKTGGPFQGGSPLPPNTYSDMLDNSTGQLKSVTIVLLDRLNTFLDAPQSLEAPSTWFEGSALANARQHLLESLKSMNPGNRIAIYDLGDSLSVLCDFTCDRDQLIAAVTRFKTSSVTSREKVEPGSSETGVDGLDPTIDRANRQLASMTNQNRAQITFSALRAIAAHVVSIPGRKNLIWLSANLPFSGKAMAAVVVPAKIAVYPIDARGLQTYDANADLQTTLTDKGGLNQTSQPVSIAQMAEIADATGGRAFVNSNGLTRALQQAIGDSAVTYTLGFYLDPASVDGKFHNLRIRVKRNGITLRYARGYVASTGFPASEDQNRRVIDAAVQSPIVSSAIPLRVHIEPIGSPPGSLDVSGNIDIQSLQLTHDGDVRRGSIAVYFVEQDTTGRELWQTGYRVHLRFTEAQFSSFSKSGFAFNRNVPVQIGTDTLRIIVQDSNTSAIGDVIVLLTDLKSVDK